jgi:hypothetical protein
VRNNQLGTMAIDITVLRFAIAQLIADNCRKTGDHEAALRRFSEKLHTRITSPQTPESLQDIEVLVANGIDNLIRSAQVALNI